MIFSKSILLKTLWFVSCMILFFSPALALEFNVKDYGAIEDDNLPDDIAIQNAINAAAQEGGGNVILPSGSYITESKLVMKANVCFSGVGRAIQDPPSIIVPTSDVQIAIQGYRTKGFEISHLGIDMSNMGDNSYGIYFQGVWTSKIDDVRIIGLTGNRSRAIELRAMAKNTPTFGTLWNRISDVYIFGHGEGKGVVLNVDTLENPPATRTNATTLTNVTVHSLNRGFYLNKTGSGTLFINCGAENNTGDGMYVGTISSSQGAFVKILGGEFSSNGNFDIAGTGKVVLFGTVAPNTGANVYRLLDF